MRFEPVADDSALRPLENLSTEAEDDPANEHNPKDVVETTITEDKLPQDAEHASDDEDNPGANAVNKYTSRQWDDNIGEGVKCI